MKRAVWLPNWIGDAVMATPALRLLRDSDPDGKIVGIYRPPIADALAGTGLVDKMILDESRKVTWKQKLAFVRQLRQEGCDEIVLLTNSLRTAAIARLSGIPRRIGFSRDGRGLLLTDRLQPLSKSDPNPVLDEYLRLAGKTVGQKDLSHISRQMELSTSRDDQIAWQDFASRHCLDEGHYVCFNSGGAFGAAKHWPVEHFAKLALRVVEKTNMPVVMLCGPSEKTLAREFVELADHPLVHSLAEEAVSVGLSKAMVQHASMMVTTDSGPRHFAAAFGTPVLTLFGPTHIAWSETYFEQQSHLQLDMDCGPCQQRTCPLGHHRCMTELTVDRAFRAFKELHKRTQPQKAAA